MRRPMKSDIEIAQEARLRPIEEVARDVGIDPADFIPYGRDKAKISHLGDRARARAGPRRRSCSFRRSRRRRRAKASRRRPSASARRSTASASARSSRCASPRSGPCFGVKGGAAGGGYSQVVPMEDINLHFTGDFPAITAAHNLLAAMVDNHLHHGNALGIDQRDIPFRRVLDMNDRALRDIGHRPRRQDQRRAARDRLRHHRGLRGHGDPVPRARPEGPEGALRRDRRRATRATPSRSARADLKAHGAMAALLKDAIHPNLVQTLEGTPALVHGGPFANIAHGCNSILATRIAMRYGEIAVTEAGFGFDLGGEKFLDIKCAYADIWPSVVVLVATVRALKMHGGAPKDTLGRRGPRGPVAGGPEPRAAPRQRPDLRPAGGGRDQPLPDRHAGRDRVPREALRRARTSRSPSPRSSRAAAPAARTSRALVLEEIAGGTARYRPLYPWDRPLAEKIEIIARRLYGAGGVSFSKEAEKRLARYEKQGFGNLPINIAKTPYSFSDDPKKGGRPSGFTLHVDKTRLFAGAGFVVAICGDIMTMPGLAEEARRRDDRRRRRRAGLGPFLDRRERVGLRK